MKISPITIAILGVGGFIAYRVLKKPASSGTSSDGGTNGTSGTNGDMPPPPPPPPPPPLGTIPATPVPSATWALSWSPAVEQTVRTKAQALYDALPMEQQVVAPTRMWALARDTVAAIWPGQPWPSDPDDTTWVSQAGPMGISMSTIFVKTLGIAEQIYGYAPP
jgi:hypothetical protein